MTYDKDPGKGG